MNITAEIKTGKRRMIEYLLSPAQREGSESLQERYGSDESHRYGQPHRNDNYEFSSDLCMFDEGYSPI